MLTCTTPTEWFTCCIRFVKIFFFFPIFEEYIPGFTSTYKVMWRWPNIAEMKFEKHHIYTMKDIHNTSVQNNKLYIISFFFLLEDIKN